MSAGIHIDGEGFLDHISVTLILSIDTSIYDYIIRMIGRYRKFECLTYGYLEGHQNIGIILIHGVCRIYGHITIDSKGIWIDKVFHVINPPATHFKSIEGIGIQGSLGSCRIYTCTINQKFGCLVVLGIQFIHIYRYTVCVIVYLLTFFPAVSHAVCSHCSRGNGQ